MNREIKFRGYSDYHKMWYYGSIVKIHRRYYIYNAYGNRFEVIPESIGEYTGLKDKNGVEIYEGDILQGYMPQDFENKKIEIVEWKNCSSNVNRFNVGFRTWIVDFEIIGNIHENPELLK